MTDSIPAAVMSHLQGVYEVWSLKLGGYARRYFWNGAGRESQEDSVAEVIAIGWKWFLGAWRRTGELPVLDRKRARYLCGRVQRGSRCAGNAHVGCVLAGRLSRKHVRPYGPAVALRVVQLADAIDLLPAREGDSPAEEACLRVDFECWLARQDERTQMILFALWAGESLSEVARWMRISPAYLCRMRQAWRASWEAFQGLDGPLTGLAAKQR